MKNSLIVHIALRYLRGKGTANAVPILSRISMLAIAVSSCAMIVLFSVFNGFESLVDEMYKAFYPDIRISLKEGKFFVPDAPLLGKIRQLQSLKAYTYVLEDNVLVNTEDGDYLPVTVKGVSSSYFAVSDIQHYIVKGNDSLIDDAYTPTAIVGQRIAAQLGINVDNVFSRIKLFYPNPDIQPGQVDPTNAFQSLIVKPDGTFYVQDEFDSKYILAPLSKVQSLMRQPEAVSSIELKLRSGVDMLAARDALQDMVGSRFTVATRYQQNKSVYMVMRSEKWAGYAILLFVLLIASFNMVSALSLLVLEKQRDMGILRAMGFVPFGLSKLIVLEGVLWALVGGGIGLLTGLLLCWAQIHFKLIKIEGAFVIDAYPVALRFGDVFVVLGTVILVGVLAAIYPARKAAIQSWGLAFNSK